MNIQLLKKLRTILHKRTLPTPTIEKEESPKKEDSKIDVNNEEVFIDERIIDINKQTANYKITRMKHSKTLSTFYVKFFSSNKSDYEFFHLAQDEALTIAKEVVENTASLENIDKIINLKEVLSYLPIEDNIKPIQCKKKSNLPPSDSTLYM